MEEMRQQVLSQLNRDELVQMVRDLVNIHSPTGGEAEVAEYLSGRFGELGLRIHMQEVESGRSNVIGTWAGNGGDASLMFLGHMDHAPGIGEPIARTVDERWIAGIGSSNMKSAFACYYMATKMLMGAGFEPRGDIYLAAVVGEIERAPIGDHQGAECRGSGYGARYLSSHGYLPDLVLNGEPTGLRVQISNGGYMFIRLTTRGVTQHASYRQFGVDAIQKMERILPLVRQWEGEYQDKFKHDLVLPRVNIGAIEGGVPQNPPLVANFCHAYMDVMLVPGTDILAVKREVQGLVRRLNDQDSDLGLEMHIYMTSPGYEIPYDANIARTARQAHREVAGADPDEPEASRFGVSSDNWAFSQYGARGITYGPAGKSRAIAGAYAAYDPDYGEVVNIDDLATCSQVYALTALDLMSASREQAMS